MAWGLGRIQCSSVRGLPFGSPSPLSLSSPYPLAAEAAHITFVASNGNDANPCTVLTAPCKTLQRAYTVTP